MNGLWRRLLVLFRRERFDRELEEEMRFHLEMQAEENRENGMNASEARCAAKRQFGNATLLKEVSRDTWGWGPVERLQQDLGYAFRMMRKTPVFTVTALLVLALAIGGNTTIFSMVNALLLSPFPYPQPDRLVSIQVRQDGERWYDSVLIRDFCDWREQNAVFEEIAAFGWSTSNVTGQSLPGFTEPERMICGQATAGFLRVLGVVPALGRFFTPEEDRPGGPPVVVLSYGMWQRRFGGRADVLGQTLSLAGLPHTIIGVMPARMPLPGMFTCDFWRPSAYDPASSRGTRYDGDQVVARLRPGIALARAQADLRMIESRLAQQYPESDRGWEVRVMPIGKHLAEAAGGTLSALTAALGLVLLLASANLAGLVLARSAARAKEIAVRATLGASRGRLIRQMLTESVLLSLLGGGLGLVLAQWGISVLGARAPAHMGLDSALRIDGTVLAFTLAVSVLTGIVFGLAPAAYGSKADLNAVLKGTAGSCNSLLRGRFLSGLVIVEIALAVVLLISGGLLTKNFARLINVDTGVRTKQLLTFQLVLPRSKYNAGPKRAEFFLVLLERMRSLPGVREAGAVNPLPMSGQYSGGGFRIEGRPVPKRWQDMAAQYCAATPAYFSTMGIPVLLGREFGAMDRSGAPAVVIINQALARRFFPNENPIGRRINDARIIGVVGDVRHNGPARDPGPQIYSPLAQQPSSMAFVAIRTTVDPMKLAQAVRGEVRGLDPELPVSRLKPMDDVVSEFLAEERMIASILGGFGLFGLALAAIGIYGVIAYSVNQRTHEIGIRVALGATSGNVLALVLRKGAWLAAAGLVIGIPAALAASRVIGSLLYGVSPRDVTVFVGTPVVLVVVALAATYIPARRAAKVDPLEALRSE